MPISLEVDNILLLTSRNIGLFLEIEDRLRLMARNEAFP